jgi:4-phytase/acid phosphatase
MALHRIETDLMRRTPYIASHNAARLAQAVVAAVEGRPGLPEQGRAGVKMVIIAGHDTNLSNLAGVLGLDWTLTGQPDVTPPDGSLVFEVWRAPANGARYVRLRFIYQTLDQLRDETPLGTDHPPGVLSLRLPDCDGGPGATCPARDFTARVLAMIPAECRG